MRYNHGDGLRTARLQRRQHRTGPFFGRQIASRHLIILEIDLDQSNNIAIRVAYKRIKPTHKR